MPVLAHGSGPRLDERARIRIRVASARWLRARPTFLVLGAQKSGTTALHHYLLEHGAVLCAHRKEVDYFDLNYRLGDGWYLTHFPAAWDSFALRRRMGTAPAVGELSPSYLLDPRVPERVHRFDPTLKLVVLLRDPVERAYSHYQHVRRRGKEALSFREAVEREEDRLASELVRMRVDLEHVSNAFLSYSYLARGRYAEQLERWFAHFPREQFFILESTALRNEPRESVERLSAFLRIPASRAVNYPLIGVTDYACPPDPRTRDWLAQYFEPHNRRLYDLLGREFAWTLPSAESASVGAGSLVRSSGESAYASRARVGTKRGSRSGPWAQLDVGWKLRSPRVVPAAFSFAGIAGFTVAALLIDAFTDRDWAISGLEWPADFVTAVVLVCLVALVYWGVQALSSTRRRLQDARRGAVFADERRRRS